MPIELSNGILVNSIAANAGTGGWSISGSFVNEEGSIAYGRAVDLYLRSEGDGSWDASPIHAFNGHIVPLSILFDRKQSTQEVQMRTSDWFLELAGLQGIYLVKKASPANNHQIAGMTLGSIVKHIVDEHISITTFHPDGFVDTSGVDVLNSTSVDVYMIRQSNSIWQTLKTIATNEFYVVYFDKHNDLHYIPHPQFTTPLPASIMTIDSTTMIDQPEVTYRNELKIDQLKLYALTDTGETLTAEYPTSIATDGRIHKLTNLRCNSQARLDVLAERGYKWMNRDIEVTISMTGPWGLWMELYDRIAITYAGTTRNKLDDEINWVGKAFWISGITVERIGNFGAKTTLKLDEETS